MRRSIESANCPQPASRLREACVRVCLDRDLHQARALAPRVPAFAAEESAAEAKRLSTVLRRAAGPLSNR
jgi:hypothetical protein